ncbi:MAG: dephospho-CoA kinase [Gammaproteobacteria bacterium]|nr:dephospho-CoA kinase [Gammaproteobacteria bacterium]
MRGCSRLATPDHRPESLPGVTPTRRAPVLSVAVTGNIASGKSTVLRAWARAGVPVISADDLAREVVEAGTDGLREVVRVFGEEVLGPDGQLDRARLRDRVFRDEDARRKLESILHPRIRESHEGWLREQRRQGVELVAAEIPLLFETGYARGVDVAIVVAAPRAVRLERLGRLRGLDAEEAARIMSTQADAAETGAMADHVIPNDGTPADLELRALELLARLRARIRRERG